MIGTLPTCSDSLSRLSGKGCVIIVSPCCDGTYGERAANRHNPLRPKKFSHLTRGFPDSLSD